MLRKCALGAGVTALLTTYPAFAHHPSGSSSTSGAGPIATISATTLDQGQSVAGIVFEMVKISPFSDTQLKSLAGQHIHAHSLDAILAPSLVFAYGLTSDLTISARLPYIVRQNIREGAHSHGPGGDQVDARGDADGIGDLTLLGQHRFFNNQRSQTEAALLLGVKVPTGRTDIADASGERFEAEFQPGSGSWDGLFGLAFTQRFGAWSFDTSVLYQLATTGTQATDLGDRLLYNAAVSHRLFGGVFAPSGRMNAGLPQPMYHGGPGKGARHHRHEEAPVARGPALDLVLELNGEWHDYERIAGVKEGNSGGNVVYVSPGVRLSMDTWSGFVSFGVPVVNAVNGVQAEPSWRLLTGFAVAF
jgi:hypothetical protein